MLNINGASTNQNSSLVNKINFDTCSFKDIYNDIPKWFKESIDKYLLDATCKKDFLSKNNNDTRLDNEDICKSVIKECLIKDYGKDILEKIRTNLNDKIFNTVNDEGKVESKGILDITKEYFCAKCVIYYCNEYLRPVVLSENQKTSGGHFVIYHGNSLNEKTFKDMEKSLDENFDRICDFFKLSEEEKSKLVTDVYVYDDQEFFHLCCFGKKMEEWVDGFGGSLGIHLVSPEKVKPPRTYEWQLQTLTHEFVHVVTFLDHVVRPGWICEGIAKYLSDDIPSKYQLQNTLYKFPLNKENINNIFSDDRKKFDNTGGYTYSYTIMDYIVNTQEFGKKKLQEILKNPKKSPFEILGVSKEEFQKGWVKYIEERYLSEEKFDLIFESFKEFIDENVKNIIQGNDFQSIDIFKKLVEENFYEEKFLEMLRNPNSEIYNIIDLNEKNKNVAMLNIPREDFYEECIKRYCNEYLKPKILSKHKNINIKGIKFCINYYKSLSEEVIDSMENKLIKYLDKRYDFFDLSKDKNNKFTVNIDIFNDKRFFDYCSYGRDDYPWVLGNYCISGNGGDVKINMCITKIIDNKKDIERYATAPAHELDHSLLNRYSWGYPNWFREGLAQFYTEDIPGLRNSDLKDMSDVLQLRDDKNKFKEILDNIFSFSQGNMDAFKKCGGYPFSYTLIDYIVNAKDSEGKYIYGEGKLKEIYINSDKKPIFNEESKEGTLGVTREDFCKGWLDYVSNIVSYMKEHGTYPNYEK